MPGCSGTFQRSRRSRGSATLCYVAWIEEPLPADDLTGYAELCERCPIPIAGGEHEFTAKAFEPLIERKLHQVLQPGGLLVRRDDGAGGDISRVRAAGVRVCPHRGAEVWGFHAIAALDAEPLAESVRRGWHAWMQGNLHRRWLHSPKPCPGFGVSVNEETLELQPFPV